jgi:transcriptional regulatory protein LevR
MAIKREGLRGVLRNEAWQHAAQCDDTHKAVITTCKTGNQTTQGLGNFHKIGRCEVQPNVIT